MKNYFQRQKYLFVSEPTCCRKPSNLQSAPAQSPPYLWRCLEAVQSPRACQTWRRPPSTGCCMFHCYTWPQFSSLLTQHVLRPPAEDLCPGVAVLRQPVGHCGPDPLQHRALGPHKLPQVLVVVAWKRIFSVSDCLPALTDCCLEDCESWWGHGEVVSAVDHSRVSTINMQCLFCLFETCLQHLNDISTPGTVSPLGTFLCGILYFLMILNMDW